MMWILTSRHRLTLDSTGYGQRRSPQTLFYQSDSYVLEDVLQKDLCETYLCDRPVTYKFVFANEFGFEN